MLELAGIGSVRFRGASGTLSQKVALQPSITKTLLLKSNTAWFCKFLPVYKLPKLENMENFLKSSNVDKYISEYVPKYYQRIKAPDVFLVFISNFKDSENISQT